MHVFTRALAAAALLTLTGTVSAGGHSEAGPVGKEVYETSCANCHSGGFGGFFTGAPKVGKQSDWQPLIAKGVDALTATTIAGIGKMAARGGCEACSDADIRAAVEYMVAQSR
ncbi:MAG: c-type cytochrome [Gammaproteobacteria bacterium]|nr:c-type cytochrome [Gammaproteobacteria bacterium]